MTGGQKSAARADGYGIPGVRVVGNDPEAMYSAFAEAVARARAGEGPTLLECMTFRFFGHNFGDDDSYIPKEQKAAAMEADPVPRLRSEEHTSELQSLMRISYAVFCLKKKNKKEKINTTDKIISSQTR